MSVDEIIDTLNKGKSLENEAITVQFIEGKRLTDYAKKISENFPYTEEEIIEVSKDKEFLNKLIMIKHKLIVLTCFLLVIGIIESICAVMNADLGTYCLFLLLGLICYVLSYDLF